MEEPGPTRDQIRRAKISFVLAGVMAVCAIYLGFDSPDAEAMFLLPIFASPFVAVAIGYGIGSLSGHMGESICICLFLALFVDVYLFVQLL